MRKDSEEMLRVILNKKNQLGEDVLDFNVSDFSMIPNFDMNLKDIMEDLKIHNCISSNSSVFLGGGIGIYLTMDGISYFENKEQEKKSMNGKNYTNNFNGPINGMQLQQGTIDSNQTQTVSVGEFDYDKIANVISQIKQYDNMFDSEYKEQAVIVRGKLAEIETLVSEKKEPNKIKMLLGDLKNLSIGVAGSLIASGVVGLISTVL